MAHLAHREDVAFCLDRTVKGPKNPAGRSSSPPSTRSKPLTRRRSSSPSTTPWAPFEADLALYGASIFPKAAFDAQQDKLWEHPIGTGPFMFDSWEKGAQIVLKKYPDYWDEGKPYLDELTFKVLTDSNARVLQLQGGELDIATDVPFNQIEPLSANPDFVLVPDAVARIDYIGMNLLRQPLDDKNLRQAINYAVDKDSIIQNVLFGAGKLATSYLPLMPGNDPNSPGYPFDLEKAKQLVADSAGKDGFKFELLTTVGDAVGSQVAQLVAASLAQIGGTVTLTQVEPGTRPSGCTDSISMPACRTTPPTSSIPMSSPPLPSTARAAPRAVWTSYKNDEVEKLVEDARDGARSGQAPGDVQQDSGHPSRRCAVHLPLLPIRAHRDLGARQELPRPANRQLPAARSLAGRRLARVTG